MTQEFRLLQAGVAVLKHAPTNTGTKQIHNFYDNNPPPDIPDNIIPLILSPNKQIYKNTSKCTDQF